VRKGLFVGANEDRDIRKRRDVVPRSKMVSQNFHNPYASSSSFSDPIDGLGGHLAYQDAKGQRNRKRSRNVIKKTLQEFYQETPNYFRPPDVKTFVT